MRYMSKYILPLYFAIYRSTSSEIYVYIYIYKYSTIYISKKGRWKVFTHHLGGLRFPQGCKRIWPTSFRELFWIISSFHHAVCDAQVHFDSCCKRISLCFRASWCNAMHFLNLSNLTFKTPSLPGFPVANLYVFKNMTSCWFHAICIENAASKAFKDKFLLPLRTAVFVFWN